MLAARTDSVRWTQDAQGQWLCILTPKAREIAEAFQQGKLHDLELKEHREKRSKTANAKMWAMLGELAEALDTTAVDLYRAYIKDYGISKDFTLTPQEAATFATAWGRQGIAWFAEVVDYSQDKQIVRAYYGSSVYNTKQMSRLIDHIIADCKDQGIQTMTALEREILLDQWDDQRDTV